MSYPDPTGDCSFNGQWDGQNYDFNVPMLNIIAKKYNAHEVAEHLPNELKRAINESQELEKYTKLLPYISCEPPITFGGTDPAITCTATNAREIADVIVNWLVDRVKFSLILAWPQAEKNRAADEALEELWEAKPLPFATRVHADPDYQQSTIMQDTDPDFTGETLSPGLPKLQSHHELHQLQETDTTVDIQTESDDDNDELLKSEYIVEGANEVIVDNDGATPEERPDYAIRRRQTLDDVLRETENMEIPALIDIAANHSQKHRLWRAIDDQEESGEYYRLPAEQIERYRYIYLAVCYGKEYAHARFACNDPNLTDEERINATILFDRTYSYSAYESPATQRRDNAFIERVIIALNDPDRIAVMNRHYRNLTLATNQKEREDIFITMSNDVLNYICVDLPVEFDPKLGRTRMGNIGNHLPQYILAVATSAELILNWKSLWAIFQAF